MKKRTVGQHWHFVKVIQTEIYLLHFTFKNVHSVITHSQRKHTLLQSLKYQRTYTASNVLTNALRANIYISVYLNVEKIKIFWQHGDQGKRKTKMTWQEDRGRLSRSSPGPWPCCWESCDTEPCCWWQRRASVWDEASADSCVWSVGHTFHTEGENKSQLESRCLQEVSFSSFCSYLSRDTTQDL